MMHTKARFVVCAHLCLQRLIPHPVAATGITAITPALHADVTPRRQGAALCRLLTTQSPSIILPPLATVFGLADVPAAAPRHPDQIKTIVQTLLQLTDQLWRTPEQLGFARLGTVGLSRQCGGWV